MAAQFGTISTTSVDSGNLTVSRPASTADGDLLLAIGLADPDGSTFNAPAGFTQQGSTLANTVGDIKVWTKTAASEPASYTWTADGLASRTVFLIRITGADTSAPVDVGPTTGTGASSTTHTAPSISPSGTDSLLVCAAMALVGGSGTTVTYTSPGTMTERGDSQPTPTRYIASTVATQELTASGATGTRAFTASLARTWNAVSIAIKSAGGGAINLAPVDSAHGHAADSPTITQAHDLAPAGSAHAHTVEQPAVTQTHLLAPAESVHAHAAEASALTQVHALAPTDAAHGHAAESPALTQAHALAPQDSAHGHAAESPVLSSGGSLAPVDSAHGHTTESPTLTQAHALAAADSAHAHSTDAAALTQAHQLAPADSTHAHFSESLTLQAGLTLAPASSSHGHATDTPALTQAHEIAPTDSGHEHTVEAPTLTQVHALVPVDTLHAHAADSPSIVIPTGLPPPAERLVRVPAESRTLTVPAESRTVSVPTEARIA